MQMLHPLTGSLQQYEKSLSDPNRYRPDHCPQCQAQQSLIGHGFYVRTLVDCGFDGAIRVRRYLCRLCQRTVSLLPELAPTLAAIKCHRNLGFWSPISSRA